MATAREIAEAAEQRDARNRWFLSLPALVVIFCAGVGPLAVMLVYSFLEKSGTGGVIWNFSLDGWFSVFLERDIFDDTLSVADAHLSILWRSVRLSAYTTILCLIFGFPTAYFIATRPEKYRDVWLFLITIPFWTSYLIRVFLWKVILGYDGVVNSALMGLGVISEPLTFILYNVNSVIITLAHAYAPFAILPIYVALEKIDRSLLEAGQDLGESKWMTFLRVTLPLAMPGVVGATLIVFIPTVGDYVTPQLVGGPEGRLIANMIQIQYLKIDNYPLGSAIAVTTMVLVGVVSLVFLFLNRRFLRGQR